MATTIPEPPKIDQERLPSQGDGGGWRNLVPAGGDLPRVKDPSSPPPASTGIWVGLAAITMTFAAFTSALIVRQGGATDWQHFTLPPILYFNTLLIIASSVTLEVARRQIAAFMSGSKEHAGQTAPAPWLYITSVHWPAVRRRANLCLDATQVPGIRAGQQRQLFVLLCAHGGPCSACVRRPWRPGARDRQK